MITLLQFDWAAIIICISRTKKFDSFDQILSHVCMHACMNGAEHETSITVLIIPASIMHTPLVLYYTFKWVYRYFNNLNRMVNLSLLF